MSESNYYYYKREHKGNNNRLIKTLLLSFLFFVLGVSLSGSIFWHISSRDKQTFNTKVEKLTERLQSVEVTQGATLNTVSTSDFAAGGSLIPGWVVHIYNKPKAKTDKSANDVGIFILDESTFPLNLHEFHNVKVSKDPIYRMNAFYNAKEQGKHQLNLTFNLPEKSNLQNQTLSSFSRCHVTLNLEDKQVIQKQFSISHADTNGIHINGTMELDKGLHPMELRMSCEDKSSIANNNRPKEDILVSIRTRSPIDIHPVLRRDAFWYRLQTASL